MNPTTVTLVRAAERTVGGTPTPGMIRETALASSDLWSGIARTQPGNVSGWHHHGQWDTVAFLLTGRLHLEFGPGGRQAVDAEPGDFVFIPGGEIHRESNPSSEEQSLVVVRHGDGPVVINTDGPAPG